MLASVAAWPVQFDMRLLGLHIYASQVCTETALICRDEVCRITVYLAGGQQPLSHRSSESPGPAAMPAALRRNG